MKYYHTTTVKRTGSNSLCFYVPQAWGLEIGTEVNVEIRKADATENDPIFSYVSTIRRASTTAQKLTIPKFFGLAVGDWVTYDIWPIGV